MAPPPQATPEAEEAGETDEEDELEHDLTEAVLGTLKVSAITEVYIVRDIRPGVGNQVCHCATMSYYIMAVIIEKFISFLISTFYCFLHNRRNHLTLLPD